MWAKEDDKALVPCHPSSHVVSADLEESGGVAFLGGARSAAGRLRAGRE
jgi:hypothetical protein